MKAIFFAAAAMLLLHTTAPAQTEERVGPMTVADMLDLPGWFNEDFISYTPQREYSDAIPQHMGDVEIICVLGTWCSDSKREVPRMIRIMQANNIAPEKLLMFGVDRQKRDPDGMAQRYNIEKVPTFVFLRNGKEIGRIVESPLATLEKDMLGIVDPNAGKGVPPPPPEHMPPPPETIEGADGTVHPPDGHHPPEHPIVHPHEQPQTDQEPPR